MSSSSDIKTCFFCYLRFWLENWFHIILRHSFQRLQTTNPTVAPETATAAAENSRVVAPLVPSAEELEQMEQASAVASEVTSQMLTQKLELEEKKRSVSMLQKALVDFPVLIL